MSTNISVASSEVVAEYDAAYAEAVNLAAVPEFAFNLTTPNLLPPLPTSQYHCSLNTLVHADGLHALTLHSRNVGRLLVTTIVRKPFKFPVATASPEVLVVDPAGVAVRAHLCGLPYADDRAALEKRFPVGSALIFVHPFYREQTDKARVLRAERPCEVRVLLVSPLRPIADAVEVSSTEDPRLVESLWQAALADATAHKQLGNERFTAGQHEAAVDAYVEGVLCLLSDLPAHMPPLSATTPMDLADQGFCWRLPPHTASPASATMNEAALDVLATLLCNASTASFKRGHARQSLYLAQASLHCRRVIPPASLTGVPEKAMKPMLRLIVALLEVYRLDVADQQLTLVEQWLTTADGDTHTHVSDVTALRREWTQKEREMSNAANLAQWLTQARPWPRERSFVHPSLVSSDTPFSSEGTAWPSLWSARAAIPAGAVLLVERAVSCRRAADSPEALGALLDHLEAHADALLPVFLPLPTPGTSECRGTAPELSPAVTAMREKKARRACWMHISDDMIGQLGGRLAHRAEKSVLTSANGVVDGTVTVSLGALASSLPHDCTPCAQVVVKGDTIFVIALRPLAAGQRVTRSFCPTFLPTVLRHARLLAECGLTCACDRCCQRGDLWGSGQREGDVSEWRCPLCHGPTRAVLLPTSLSPAAEAPADDTTRLVCASIDCAWPGETRATAQGAFHEALVALDADTRSCAPSNHSCEDGDTSRDGPSLWAVEKRLPEGSWLRSMGWCRLGRRAASHTDTAGYTSCVRQLNQQCAQFPPPAELRCFVVDMVCQALVSFHRPTFSEEELTLLGSFGLSESLLRACVELADGSVQAVYTALS